MSQYHASVRSDPWLASAVGTTVFVALLWLVETVDAVADHRLDDLGIHPRSDEGLLGIVFAPLLHGGWQHLQANTVPVAVLLFVLLISGFARALQATGIIWLVGGAGVWLVAGSDTIHLGASILIFGWIIYLMLRGFYTGRPGEIVVGAVVFVMYGYALVGVIPGQAGISWQGHLFGAVGGGLAAAVLGRRDRARTVV